MISKFTPQARACVLHQLAAGATVAEASEAAGVAAKTVQSWLARGRRDREGDYFEFALAAEGARAAHAPAALVHDEYLEHLAAAVRSGSVQAMKLWWQIHGDPEEPDAEEPADPFDELDEVAEARRRRETG